MNVFNGPLLYGYLIYFEYHLRPNLIQSNQIKGKFIPFKQRKQGDKQKLYQFPQKYYKNGNVHWMLETWQETSLMNETE